MKRRLVLAFSLFACGEPSKPAEVPPPAPSPSPSPSPAPSPTASSATPCEGAAPGQGYECLQGCGPPVAREGDAPPPFHWMTPEQVRARKIGGCPRCLRRGTKIATPTGDVPIDRLHMGEPIWTTSVDGRRVASVVRLTSTTAAPRDHRMVRVRFADGRSVVASPGHPTADGTGIGTLVAGSTLDRGRVVAVETLSLEDDRTFDVRPDGETGQYWADGVLLGSTLSR